YGFPAPLAAAVTASPLRALHWPARFVTVVSFGEILLFAAGLDAIRRLVSPRIGGLIAAAAVLFAVPAALHLADVRMLEIPAIARNRAVYDFVHRATAADPGPLLELPLFGPPRADGGGTGTEVDAMIGSTRHWLPLLGGYTGYHPPHRRLVLDDVGFRDRVPAEDKIADLVDMTHLRWILLRPMDRWTDPQERRRLVNLAERSALLRIAGEQDGWTLLRVERTPQHPAWFAAIARGWRPGETVLGTPLAPLSAGATGGDVTVVELPPSAVAGRWLPITLRVHNASAASWPAATAPKRPIALHFAFAGGPDNFPREDTVVLAVHWSADLQHEIPLRRDLAPGDTIIQPLLLTAPPAPGVYELDVRLEQVGSDAFQATPLRRTVTVVSP
ncbi:MAG TPA: hypothetical protein VJS87_03355, partial [Solirubrobacterales bacterium]|nr:hypothetical protein [Solirubrobacterales bacterium]